MRTIYTVGAVYHKFSLILFVAVNTTTLQFLETENHMSNNCLLC